MTARSLRWLTVAAPTVMVLGFVALVANSIAEVLGNPGTSLVDGYWRGQLPWIEFGVLPIVIGSSATIGFGALAVWVTGGWNRRLAVLPPLFLAAFWWLVAMQPPLLGAPCQGPEPCPQPPVDPWAFAYSLPETALVFLVLPALAIGVAALAGRQKSDPALTAQ